ncbi:hypothetical protein [Nonomuraea jabiensis]|uniref:Uncharacterized protein n=1 Tax=Nonomuraea jabiensis TaxID=882448 RepID=A0A7W9FY04_9ACTN|nr:hypothetical protein [Nonomuraea jabiensis]MBB5773611.1 hypothetical protein [Nonomuraea jabiensis]
MAVWTEQQLAAFLTGIAQDRLYAAWRQPRYADCAAVSWPGYAGRTSTCRPRS